jgi:preprotein translocase subunit SecE
MHNKLRTNFLKDVWFELTTKTTYPTFKRLVKATTIVIVFIMVWATILWVFDSMFTGFQKWVVSDYYDPVLLEKGEIKKFNSEGELQKWMDEQKAKGVEGYVPKTEDTTTPPTNPIQPPTGENQ